jgi:HD-GYP domain-containing protein (c-di-GMP phosphodiesterase class II)
VTTATPAATLPPLSAHRQQVRIGVPLPFGICDSEGRLLLARGQLIDSIAQFDGLLERGAYIVRDLAAEAAEQVDKAKVQQLPALWTSQVDRLGRVLRATVDVQFTAGLEVVAQPVLALIRRDPDLAIYQVVRADDGIIPNYASRHALHAAIASHLGALRLGWGEDTGRHLFRAALTMNLAMTELQNRLAQQVSPPTASQRQAIHEHPSRGAELLEQGGVTDPDWLQAVARHHEQPDGSGYPHGLTDVGELALMLNRADDFTARFSPRAARPGLAPDAAVREFFQADPQNPMAAAIVKEFGLYPPGSPVRLKTGEVGIVMRRGEKANAPIVAVVTARNGDALSTPQRRDCADPACAVVAVVPMSAVRVRMPVERLAQACAD